MSESHGGRPGDRAWPFGPTGASAPTPPPTPPPASGPAGSPPEPPESADPPTEAPDPAGPPTAPVPPWSTPPEPATPGDGSADPLPPAPGESVDGAPDNAGRPRRGLLIGGIVVGVLALGGIAYGLVNALGGGGAPPAETRTVQLPSPTPTVDAIDRGAGSPFFEALPSSVLQYALASTGPADAWTAAGALEAYTFTYSDGADGQVVVLAGQWETPPEATAFADGLVPALPPTKAPAEGATDGATDGATGGAPASVDDTGDVQVGGETVGTYTIRDLGDGTAVAIWQNGTSVFQATAPVADIADVYAAFPL